MIGVWVLTPLFGQKALKVGGVDGPGLLLDQVFDALLFFLLHTEFSLTDSALGILSGFDTIVKRNSYSVLLVQWQCRPNLIVNFLVITHDLDSFLDMAI